MQLENILLLGNEMTLRNKRSSKNMPLAENKISSEIKSLMRKIPTLINKKIILLLAIFAICVFPVGCGSKENSAKDKTAVSQTEDSGTGNDKSNDDLTDTETAADTDNNSGADQSTDNWSEETDNSQQDTTYKEKGDTEETMIYVALGDSLTHGYGLADKQKDRFSAVIADKLRADGYMCSEFNYGVDGLTSDGLLEMLNEGQCSMTGRADLITIDIGANDVLHTVSMLAAYAMYDMAAPEDEYESIQAELDNSLDQYRSNFETLIDNIKRENPNARIICTTIYNPYKNLHMTIQVPDGEVSLSEYTDTVVTRLNNVMREVAADKGIEVADSYTAFELTNKTVLNAKNDDTGTNMDIHPNKDGYALMAEAFYQVIKSK